MRPTIRDFVGKTWAELPCWELVVAWYAAQGITLRSYTDYWMSGAPSDVGLSEWIPVPNGRPWMSRARVIFSR